MTAVRLALGLLLALPAAAQPLLTGRVTDAETGAPLPAATVQVAGTFTGTITNADGRFELRAEVPARLVVRYIGYRTAEMRAERAGPLAVALAPDVVQGETVVVTDEDPAERIMRRVIEAKARWQAGLRSWEAEAYARRVVERGGADSAAIAALTETATTAFWRRGEGLREVLRGARRTENLPSDEAVGAAAATQNLYDDETRFGGYRLPGPTAPEALGYYRFRLEGTRALDGRTVYDIALAPRDPLAPGWTGRVSVLEGAWAMLAADLRPSAAVRLPYVHALEARVRQQFSAFGQTEGSGPAGGTGEAGEPAWLPVDYRADGRLVVAGPGFRFPAIGFSTTAVLSGYRLNGPTPDSLFQERARRVRADSAARAAGLPDSLAAVPLTPREAAALATLDSTDRVEEQFRPSGPMARFFRLGIGDGDRDGRGAPRRAFGVRFEPEVWFNRVEALHVGVRVPLERGAFAVTPGAGYVTGPGAWTAGLELAYPLRAGRWTVTPSAELVRDYPRRYPSDAYGRTLNSVVMLFGQPDYFDYFRREGGSLGVRAQRRGFSVGLAATVERHESARETSGYDLLGDGDNLRLNPPVRAGDLQALRARAEWGDASAGLAGTVAGARGLRLLAEVGRLEGEEAMTYGRFEAALATRVATFYRRRLFPNTLSVRFAGGVSVGDLPPQRAFALDGALGAYAPFGVLRTRGVVPYTGPRYGLAAWEHDFRSVPFEALGWGGAGVRGLSLLLHGAHGWSASDGVGLEAPAGGHHEVGVGLGFGFYLPLRVDATARLDRPGWAVTLALARLF